ncbi:MAG: EAL domain-containing protein [Solirubrobacteraceae bacterium]|jgi:diguanylate cyclase (GGDEF)-like protein
MRSEALADVLSDFARTMATDFPIQGILDHLVKRIVDVLPISGAGVTLISPGTAPRYIAASNDAALRFEHLQTELDEGPCIAAYNDGEAISIPDLQADLRFPAFGPRALATGLAAVFTFPLNHEDLRLGALDLYSDSPGEMSAECMAAAQTLADVATAYLLNAQAREDLQDSANRSREASLHDPLTGLPNRTLMLERMEHAFLRGRRSHKITAVFFVDLDNFKAVNDTHGHGIGDELLIAVGERLTGTLRPGDTLSRLSGDEFVILCEDLDDPSRADTIRHRVESVLEPPFLLSGVELKVTASIGSAVTAHGDDAPAQLLRDADLAMYATKRGNLGSDFLDPTDVEHAQEKTGLRTALRGAADRGEFHLDYQPIVDALDGRLTGVEALLRWTHPSRGPVSPILVIPLAEQSGQIVEIGEWVLRQAWADRQRWESEQARDLAMSINVSGHQFMAAGFVDMVAGVLLSGSIDPKLLTLEVTETVFVRDSARASVVHHALKQIGVMLALDDFGTGYSSLTHLMSYPVDTIKVDRTFIASLGHDPVSNAIVTSVINLAHGLGMSVVSEGVETAQQQGELARLGCDSCQGFYFARPMPAASLEALIRDEASGARPRLPMRQMSLTA